MKGEGRAARWGHIKAAGTFALVAVMLLSSAGCGESSASEDEDGGNRVLHGEAANPADRVYRLRALMDGYFALEEEREDERNPVLEAHVGERVRIELVNGEDRLHDIGLRRHRVVSDIVRTEGEEAEIEFVAEHDDVYYCTIPGHEVTMRGKLKVEH